MWIHMYMYMYIYIHMYRDMYNPRPQVLFQPSVDDGPCGLWSGVCGFWGCPGGFTAQGSVTRFPCGLSSVWCLAENGGMDRYSSPYIIPNDGLHNPLLRTRQSYPKSGRLFMLKWSFGSYQRPRLMIQVCQTLQELQCGPQPTAGYRAMGSEKWVMISLHSSWYSDRILYPKPYKESKP